MKKPLTTLLTITEPLIIATVIYTFWFHSPPFRDAWVWLLWLAIPIFVLRIIVFRRIWTNTPLNYLLIAFILLTAFNFNQAPFARNAYWVLVSRPLLGIWIYLYMLEHVRQWGTLQWLAIATIGMSFAVAVVSLMTTNWHMDKSGELAFIINAIPRFEWRTVDWSGLPIWLQQRLALPPIKEMLLGFNPNEVAGALAFIVPLMAGLAVGNAEASEKREHSQKNLWTGIRLFAGIAGTIGMLSLFIGQSRFAIAGVFGALILIVLLLVRNMRWKIAGLSIIGLVIVLQAALLFNWLPSTTQNADSGLSERDQESVSTRLDLWWTAARMMFDYPLTGTGMSMFRTAVNEPEYQIEFYIVRDTTPPHAHNEWLQMGADLGIPGFLMFLAMQIVILWMLWQGWCSDQRHAQIIAVAVFGGLLAHSVYGLGDAITLWDRFSFILWWLVGLAGAQYVLSRPQPDNVKNPE
jgi:O-antigen ligase